MISMYLVWSDRRTRQSNHSRSPYMLPNAEPEPYSIGEHLVAASSKLVAIDKLLADILPKGEKVLIFSVCLFLMT